jgi:protein SCO1/2
MHSESGHRLLSIVLMASGIAWWPAWLAATGTLPERQGVVYAEPARIIGDFELTNQDGRSVRFSSLKGAPALVFFGFTHCPDVCPTTLQKLKLLKQSGDGEFDQVAVVMISVDGDRDTPASLKDYLASFSGDFVGLTGDPRKIRDIAAQFPAVFFKGLPEDAAGNYRVQHTSQVYAVDRAGRVRAQFSDASVATMGDVIRELVHEGGE